LPDARNGHWLPQHLTARLGDFLHGLLYVPDPDNDGRILRRPIGLLGKEPAVDGAGHFRTALRPGFRRGRHHIVPHLFAHALHLPAEGGLVKRGQSLLIFEGHFKVYYRVHGNPPKGANRYPEKITPKPRPHSRPLCRWVPTRSRGRIHAPVFPDPGSPPAKAGRIL